MLCEKVGGVMKFIEFIRKITRQLTSPVCFDLKDEYCELFYQREKVEKRNLLIGALRTREQLSTNLRHNFYHIPLDVIGSEKGIEYIALYQSKNLFSNTVDGTGIHYIGKIVNSTILKRSEVSEIPASFNQDKLYVRFNISEWKRLQIPKKVGSSFPKVCLRTSLFLFDNALNINELKFDTVEKYVVYLGVKDIIAETYDAFRLNGLSVRRIADFLIFKSFKGKYTTSVKKFFSNTDEILEEIYLLI